jgi:hypothetical protein
MALNLGPNVDVQKDAAGRIRQLTHLFDPYTDTQRDTPRALAAKYLADVAKLYGIVPAWLDGLKRVPGSEPEAGAPTELRFGEEKELHGTTTIAFALTHAGLPVWEEGFALVLQGNPRGVVSSHSTLPESVELERPPVPDAIFAPKRVDVAVLRKLLGLDGAIGKRLRLHESRWRLFRYDENERFHPETRTVRKGRAKTSAPPSLALPQVDSALRHGQHYLVTEVLFGFPQPGFAELNWRAFIEVDSGSVLYLRSFAACARAQVFERDPRSRSNDPAVVATATNALLNPWRQVVTLVGLTAPAPGANQALRGDFVEVRDIEAPTVAPPTRAVGADFDDDARSDTFAAANAYHLVDGMFRIMQGLGFTITGAGGYFDGTSFPVPVDHRGKNGDVNAHCLGDAQGDGIGNFSFGPCVSGTTVGMCTEFQTVAHEFGHAILHDSVHSANFGFCHSAGDSLATILNDPDTNLTGADRFQVFPWCPIGGPSERFCNRGVGSGFAWGGTRDDRGYGSEEILATTLFRAYQATGGDSNHPTVSVRRATKRQASRYAAYLIFRSIGSLATNPVTATPNVGVYATALMAADTGTALFDGYPGGTHNKVLRWSFEKQGWYQPPGAAAPVTSAGAPPAVDVYIDDGRAGEYMPYLENFWESTDIWNLTAPNPATAPGDHTTPILGVTNYLYVRVRNRGTQAANNVSVRAYHNRPSSGLMWPGDWNAMTTPVLPVPGASALSIAAGGSTIVGPFEWTPAIEGHECLLAWVSADGDRANIDPVAGLPCAAGPTPHWRFVPFDNNVAQRNVAPVPARSAGLRAAFAERFFWVENTEAKEVGLVRIEFRLPAVLAKRGWKATFKGGEVDKRGKLMLKPGEQRRVRILLLPGEAFSEADLAKTRPTSRRLRVRSIVNGIVTGGISYELDLRLKKPAPELRG